MIQIKQLTKKFGNQVIIKDLNIDFPDHGLIAITGPSGCGKTTLLNIISGIDQNSVGEVLFNGIDILKMSEKETLDYRLHHVGYVFQNFNLIPLETGERNVLLPFESSTNNSLSFKKRKIRRLFQIINISHLRRMKTTNMSGGEKQRIAILRAIVNNPQVVLCDEPTGALDEKNAFEIMQIIRQISVKSFVIVVSHDKELMKIFADEIISMKDGFITSRTKNKLPKAEVAPIETSGKRTKHARIPTSFKIRYSIGKMKSKTIRTLISNIMLSLSLTGIGISFLLSSIITKKINQAFEGLTNGNQIVMRLKNESLNTYGEVFSAPQNIVEKIAKKYENETIGVGVNYLANFEDIFKDQNEIYFIADGKRSQLKNYSVRNFNEYKWYTHKTITFPYSASLAKDDVVLGMTFEDMSNLCYEYKIQRSFYSLGQFLTKANAQINLLVANNDWEYDDEQVFNVIGVVQTSHPLFYHSDSLWNEYVFEECMRFPSFEGGEQYAPWELKKNYFLQCQSGVEELENKLMFDPDFYGYIFQKTNYDFNPVLCKSTANCNENRLYVYYSNINGIKLSDVDYISQFFPSLKRYFLTSEYGYSSYASNLINGFSKNLFVSLDESKIDDAIDADTSLGERNEVSIDLPQGITGGNFLENYGESLKFSTRFDHLINGREPSNDREIVISSGLANCLSDETVLGKRLYLASVKTESINVNDQIEKTYAKNSAVIVGIIDQEQKYLYHNNLWTISYFRDQLEINPFMLIPDGAVFEIGQEVNADEIINNIQRMFPSYSFSSPQGDLSDSVGGVLNYAQTILFAFSVISLVISFLFLGTMVLLSVNESKEEIKMFGYIGIGRGQVRGLFRSQTLIRCLIAFLISAAEMIAIENIISSMIDESINVANLQFSFTLWPILVVFLFATIIPLVITEVILLVLSNRKKIE